MENFIIDYLSNHSFRYETLSGAHLINIYNLFHDNILNEIENDVVLLHYGIYYNTKQQYDTMEKYYLRAIALGNTRAMLLLGLHYSDIDVNLTIKYWTDAIALGNTYAMNKLAEIYYDNDDYDTAVKYYSMAIDNGNCEWVISAIWCCKKCKLVTHAMTSVNKILNKGHDNIICGVIMDMPLTFDTVNVLVNLDSSTIHSPIVHLLP